MSELHPGKSPGIEFVDDLASHGRTTFTTAEALAALGGGQKAAQGVLRRLRKRREIATPVRGFHVILPPEYRTVGCRPAIQFIDALAAWLETPYYVALLTAAELHGAAHHRPQVTQVMVPTPRRPLRCGSVQIDFVQRENTAALPVTIKNTPAGTVRVATAETTALDLVGYIDHCGGLGNVAMVLKDLADEITAERLHSVSGMSPAAWSQRLGYLLDTVGADELAASIAATVAESSPAWTVLDTRGARTGTRSGRWRLIANAAVELDT